MHYSQVSSVIYCANNTRGYFSLSIEMISVLLLVWWINYGSSYNNFPSLITSNATMGMSDLFFGKKKKEFFFITIPDKLLKKKKKKKRKR